MIGRLSFPDLDSWLAFTTALGVGASHPELEGMITVETPDAPSVIQADERALERGERG